MNTRPYRIAMIVLSLWLTASCSPFKPQGRPDPEGDLPGTYSLYPGDFDPALPWWESFGSAELNALVQAALSENFTLKRAWARLRQTRAVMIRTEADRYPDLTLEGEAFYARQRSDKTTPRSSELEEYSLGLVSRYELDLWGRIRSQVEAARLDVNATRGDLQAAAVTLSAEVVERWVGIVAQRLQKELLEKQLKANRTILELIELRFRKAMVSALDVYQQKQVVENVLAEIPRVEEQEQLLHHQLALLLGKAPRTPLEIAQKDLPQPEAIADTGLPADLLANRPDVRAAGERLQAADWQVSAARANRLPAISLRAAARYGQGDLDVLFDNWLLSLLANLTAPVLDAGRRASEVERTRALADENLWAYRQAVLTAIKEVEDALVSESKQRAHLEGLQRVYDVAAKALQQASRRYRNGLSDYLPVLTQLLAVQGLERDLITQRARLVVARIGLYRALGGTWVEALQPQESTGA